MAINQRMDIKQGQSLVMTAQLQQAIKLLQLSNVELAEFVAEELEKNPLLEKDDLQNQEAVKEKNNEDNNSTKEETALNSESDNQEVPLDTGDSIAEEGYDYSQSTLAGVGAGGDSKFNDKNYNFEDRLVVETSLREHLMAQIKVDFIDNKDRAIAALMVDYLTEAGYFRTPLDELAKRLGCKFEYIGTILLRLQKLNPSGIFARDLKECLKIQLVEKNRFDPAIEKLLDNLEILAKHDLKELRGICEVDEEDLLEMIEEIKFLNPKPAGAFDHFISQTVIPDVFMKPLPKSKGGGWRVELNSDTLPRVLVNKVYYKEVSKNAKSEKDKEYLGEQLGTANWLIKAMDQRAKTILKAAGEIILQQEDFFNYGVEYLKPLILKDIAQVIEMHESTVSRVTTNKYIGTPRGVFELKYFFSSGVSNSDGSADFSSEAIKSRIKKLIEAEKSEKILSDDYIVKALKEEGIVIARRTVAKYREAMKIPSSVQRRRIKNMSK